MPIRRRLSTFQPFLWAWVFVLIIGILGALIQFRRSSNSLLEQETNFVAPATAPAADPLLFIGSELPEPALTSQSLWVYDRESGSILYEKNADTATSVASLAKLMTAFVAYETYDLTDTLTVGTASLVEGNRAKFLAADVFTVRDLLQALLMFSANDAAQTLALGVDQTVFQAEETESAQKSVDLFVAQMNARAQELKLSQTHFQNVTGLDHPDQHSSAQDIGRLVDTFLQTPFFSQTVRQQVTTITEQLTGRQDTVYTTNTMLYRGAQFTGVKTGTTELAGESLVLRLEDTWSIPIATTGGELVDTPVDIILVFLGSKDRYGDAERVTTWLEQIVRLRKNSVS